MTNQKVFDMEFARIYGLLVQKVERKGRMKSELDFAIKWLTGYGDDGLQKQIDDSVTLEIFFANAPAINPNAHLIKGTICGCKIEDIADPLMKKIRQMDKLADDLAKGKSLDKICP